MEEKIPALVESTSNPAFHRALEYLFFFGSGFVIGIGLTLILIALTFNSVSSKVVLNELDRKLHLLFIAPLTILWTMILALFLLPLLASFVDLNHIKSFFDLPFPYTFPVLLILAVVLYIAFPIYFAVRLAWLDVPVSLRYLILIGFGITLVPIIAFGMIICMEQIFYGGKICLGFTCPGYIVTFP